MEREKFSSRLGFILISAGCAIGLGNVWRFPYITGKYGGAAFVLVYLVFLLILGLPIMVMEFSVGRASQKSAALSFNILEPKGTKWHLYRYGAMAGNYLLMMFYTTVGGWMFSYVCKMFLGEFSGLDAAGVETAFYDMLAQPGPMIGWMLVVTFLGFGICSLGLQKGVERITKAMMVCLLLLMLALAVRSVTLPGAVEGLKFYLVPAFHDLAYDTDGRFILGAAIYDAMSQAFFTLSLGIGAMMIFGSYLDHSRSMTGEAINITILDTFVALTAGFIVIPACFSYGIEPGAGPSLVFITLPNIFAQMTGGFLWSALFFLFLTFAALSTIIAVFENIIAFDMDLFGWSRKKSVAVSAVLVILLSMPAVLGYNLWSGIQPLGEGSTIMDLEDFIVSNNLLPLGSLGYVLFCTRKNGWGWDGFMDETNAGEGIKFPATLRAYVTWFLPLLIAFIYLKGYYDMFSGKDTLTFVCWMIAAVVFLGFVCWCAWKKPTAKKAV